MRKAVWVLLLAAVVSSAFAARVRVSHMAPLAPAIDVYTNGQPLFRNVPFKGVSEYLSLPKGTYDIEAFPAGTREKPVLVARGVTFGEGSYTITAAGRGDLKSYFPVVFTDEAKASPNQATLRLINASPDLQAVDLAVDGGPELVRGVGYKAASSYARFGPGQYSLSVLRSGLQTPMLEIPALRLEPGKVYTLFVVGLLEGNTLNYILVEDAAHPN